MRCLLLNEQYCELLLSCWTEIRENLGRSALQSLAIVLGVASVLGGFSIIDSNLKSTKRWVAKEGGMDKLNINQLEQGKSTFLTPNQAANPGLRTLDARDGMALGLEGVEGATVVNETRLRVRNAFVDQSRLVTGSDPDYAPINGYSIRLGRGLSSEDMANGYPVAVLGSEAANTLFPGGEALGQNLILDECPVQVIGVYAERVFRSEPGGPNHFSWYNRLIHVPVTFLHKRMQGDHLGRVETITFKIPSLPSMKTFSDQYTSVLLNNHRQERDFRLDDVSARFRRMESRGEIYNLVFLLSGVLALMGGGIVNVNIQLASLKERVREVGLKMAIGAAGRMIFKEFMTEALLLNAISGLVGLILGVGMARGITWVLNIQLYIELMSFFWAFMLALVCGFLFALYPAWMASRQSPMEALRYE